MLPPSCSRRSTRARHLLLHVPVFPPPLRDGCKRAAPHLSSLASLAALPLPLCGLRPSFCLPPHTPPPPANFFIGSDWWLQTPCVRRLGCDYCPALASSVLSPARLPEQPPVWKKLCSQQTRPAALGFADAPPAQRHTPPRRPHAPPGACAGSPRVLLIEPPYSTWLYCGCPGTKRLSCRRVLLLLPETAGQGRGQTGRGSERHWGCTALQHRTILPRDFSNTARLEHAPNKTHHHHFLRRCKVLLLLPAASCCRQHHQHHCWLLHIAESTQLCRDLWGCRQPQRPGEAPTSVYGSFESLSSLRFCGLGRVNERRVGGALWFKVQSP